jgi:thymidine kinase
MSNLSVKDGYLAGYIGSMFGGKSTCLIAEITRYIDIIKYCQFKKPLLINSKIDDRDNSNVISSHSSSYNGISKDIDIIAVKNLSEVNVNGYQVIGIDEAQFFSDLYETVVQWLKKGKKIYFAGLVGDYKQNQFGDIHKLLPLVNDIKFCAAVCSDCLSEYIKNGSILTPEILSTMKASFTKKISGKQNEGNNVQIDVGSEDKYRPSCRKHL